MDVVLLERSARVGGACVTEELIPGARFSTCANVLWQLQAKVEDDMELERHGLRYDPVGNRIALYYDAEKLVCSADGESTAAEVGRLNAKDGRRFGDWSRFWLRAASLMHAFALRDAPSLDELRLQARRAGDEDVLDALLTKSAEEVGDMFFEDERVKAAFTSAEDFGPVAPGGALVEAWWKTGALTRTGGVGGAFVEGGMGSVTEAMRRAAEEAGVEVLENVEVRQIHRQGGAVAGVDLVDGRRIVSDTVVSNADPKSTFDRLLGDTGPGLEPEWSTRVGYQKFHALVRELPDLRGYFDGEQPPARESAMLRICPSLDVVREAHAAALAGELPEVPVIAGLFIPSIFDPALAPAGHHTVSAWVPYAPGELASGTWDAARDEAGRRLISRIAEFVPNFAQSLVDWRLLLPPDLEAKYAMTDGNIRHLDVVPSQFLGGRPAPGWGHRSPVPGLYLCGAGTHPGGEVTGANGFNAARCVLEDVGLAENDALAGRPSAQVRPR
jgi:phytoene dehydrogenase-like protein